MDYDFKITLLKGFQRLFLGAFLAALPVITAYLSNPDVVKAALTAVGVKPTLVSIVVVGFVAVVRMLDNWSKNYNR